MFPFNLFNEQKLKYRCIHIMFNRQLICDSYAHRFLRPQYPLPVVFSCDGITVCASEMVFPNVTAVTFCETQIT